MSEKTVSTEEKRSPGKLVLPSLVISRFATQPPGLVTSLLLVDIGLTFGTPVGVTGQIRTVAYVVGVVFALLMGVLSIRFKHRSLLVVGLLFLSITALGCGLAPDFAVMLVSYSLWGVALAMVSPMGITLVGEYFPREKRPNAVGWVISGMAISYLVGAPIIGYMAGFGGWRLAFLGFALPVSLVSFLLAVKGIPTASRGSQPAVSSGSYLEGFRGILSNRSADTCLIGTALSMAAWMALLTYSASFFRQRFLVSAAFVSLFMIATSLSYTLGSVGSGGFVKRYGRKPFTVMSALLAGIFAVAYANLADLWLSIVAVCLGCVFAGMRVTASNSLTLEQVPKFRGTMMSISTAADNLGSSLGTAIGGLVLLLFNYEGMAISLGAMGIASAIVFHLLAIDPTKAETQTSS